MTGTSTKERKTIVSDTKTAISASETIVSASETLVSACETAVSNAEMDVSELKRWFRRQTIVSDAEIAPNGYENGGVLKSASTPR